MIQDTGPDEGNAVSVARHMVRGEHLVQVQEDLGLTPGGAAHGQGAAVDVVSFFQKQEGLLTSSVG